MTSINLVRLSALCLLLALVGCAGGNITPQAPTPQRLIWTATPPPTETPPPPTETPSGPLTVQVWWPDSLAPLGDENTQQLLTEAVDTFGNSQSQARVEIRLKRGENSGGILETLRKTSPVAPGALPDLTLLRHDDLLAAVRGGFIQPFPTGSSPQSDLYRAGIELGRVNGAIYGLPFLLETQHIAYRTITMAGNFARFQNALADRQGFTFPAGGSRGVRGMLLAQYLSAGGTFFELSARRLNVEALSQVYAFYAQGRVEGLFDSSLLSFIQTSDYLKQISEGELDAALLTSTDYMGLSGNNLGLAAASFPLAAGDPSSPVDGWSWVVITTDPVRQEAALHFIDWMANPARMSAYAEAAGVLPARRGALLLWPENPYRILMDSLLAAGFVLPADAASDSSLRSIEAGLTSVLSGQRSAEQAAQDAADNA